MSIFLCQANGDFAIVSNQLWLTDNSVSAQAPSPGQETLQLIRNNLRMFLGEEPLDPTLGVPYFQQVLDKSTPADIAQSIIYQVIQDTDGVEAVLGFDMTVNSLTREVTATFTVTTSDGPVTSTETFP